jgi:mono/diheme cytochrome c family protein
MKFRGQIVARLFATSIVMAIGTTGPGLIGNAEAQTVSFDWKDIGAKSYAGSCAACHQPDGQGVPGAFPPLVGHAPEMLNRPGGRAYLARLVLYGVKGAIEVNGKPFDGMMPAWSDNLSDAELAGALDFVLNSWGNGKALPKDFAPFTPVEIAAARKAALTSDEVYALRQQGAPAAPVAAAPSVKLSFTEDQVDRGHAAYRHNCQDCHGSTLGNGEFGGAPLNGGYFVRHWGDGSVATLFGYMRTKMPPDRPGQLNPQTYADLVAFLLSSNGYMPGNDELPDDPEQLQRMSMKQK